MIKSVSDNAAKPNLKLETSETAPCLDLWAEIKADDPFNRYEDFWVAVDAAGSGLA